MDATPKPQRKAPPTLRPRIQLLDELRGLAVVCMVVYHFCYLLGFFFQHPAGLWLFDFFTPAQPIFAGIFIVSAGVSSHLSHSNLRRGLMLLGFSLGLTAVSAGLLPLFGVQDAAIWFGILHLLSVCILLFALLQRPLGKTNPILGVCVCLLLYILLSNVGYGWIGFGGALKWQLPRALYESIWLAPFGFAGKDFHSADYFPLFPHLFLFFAGSFFGRFPPPQWTLRRHIPPLGFLGRHTLPIYALHLPIAAGLSWVITLF